MAPELVTSTSYNEKVDVFSFAIIAYELFNGKLLAMKVGTGATLGWRGGGAEARVGGKWSPSPGALEREEERRGGGDQALGAG